MVGGQSGALELGACAAAGKTEALYPQLSFKREAHLALVEPNRAAVRRLCLQIGGSEFRLRRKARSSRPPLHPLHQCCQQFWG
ncbi:hypothetical protein NDU88_003211 [Pleurodeles waltl]|uniref:Uncharacterized protein n=1 Tax=Pleurodeles waltl TaxID=8319 RepID=A0AAV7NIQ2_PLEWA|nr:hypothetical protein NDU88_003211 [Pleurodeles waltl]